MALSREEVRTLFTELSDEIINELKTKLDKDVRTIINSKFAVIFKKIDEVRATANEALKLAKWSEVQVSKIKDANQENVDDLRAKFDALSAANEEMKTNIETLIIKSHVQEKRLEDQTNRSSRKSLVFSGVPERGHETWDDTRDILADVIARNANVSNNEAYDMIERCHRSSFNQQGRSGSKKVTRKIFCAFYTWDDAQYVLERFRQASIKGTNNNVYAEQRYGATTSARRNFALSVRKGLKAEGSIASGYLIYPAKLMVKHKREDKKYTLHEDYSEMEIASNETDGE